MTRRFWSLKHKSDVMQWAHGAWRLLTRSSKIRLWCKKTSKCVRCQINSFLKDTDTQLGEQTSLIDDSSQFWKYDTPRVCFLWQIIACCSCSAFCWFFFSVPELSGDDHVDSTCQQVHTEVFFPSEKMLYIFSQNCRSYSCTLRCEAENNSRRASIPWPLLLMVWYRFP